VIPLDGDPWTLSTSTDPNIDFTVWVLQRDGLRAGAFDAHPDGDGRLRSAGLTEESWLAWFQRVVRTAHQQADAVRDDSAEFRGKDTELVDPLELWFGTEPPSVEEITRYREVLRAQTSAGMFTESDATRDLLLELWSGYMRRSRESAERDFTRRVERQTGLTEEQAEALATQAGQFWDDLQAYRPLPPLHVYLVEYVKPVVSVVPPASVVIGLIDPQEDDLEKYSSLVFEGASLLKHAE
jgi:hypothetical protein